MAKGRAIEKGTKEVGFVIKIYLIITESRHNNENRCNHTGENGFNKTIW